MVDTTSVASDGQITYQESDLQLGTYDYELEVSDGLLKSYDNFRLTVNPNCKNKCSK